NAVIALLLGAASLLVIWALDRTWQGLALAIGTSIGGAVVETTLVHLRLFHHARPDVLGLPVWLPFLYFAGAVAIGNLSRYWCRQPESALSVGGSRARAAL